LHLVPHVNAPVADLPVRKVHNGLHLIADLTLPFGRVIYDYLKDPQLIKA
jgi:acetoacetate decarboxylase